MKMHEKPTRSDRKQRAKDPQFQAFAQRIRANLHVPYWPPEVMQFFTEHPEHIVEALDLGFRTEIAYGKSQEARTHLERFIWNHPLATADKPGDRAKALIIWFISQSHELHEEIVLHTPDDMSDTPIVWPKKAAHFVSVMQGSYPGSFPIFYLFRGLGCSLCLNGATNGRNAATLCFTRKPYETARARIVSWEDAFIGTERTLYRLG